VAVPPVSSNDSGRVLREVEETDIPVFFEHQLDPEASRMALFPPREREAHAAHWRRVLADDAVVKRTVMAGDQVAGNAVSYVNDGRRFVGYWIGREFWGRGLATRALEELLREVPERPLYAYVATSNAGSIRVLEKCGFVAIGRESEFDEQLGRQVEEILMTLDEGR
jgi:RimJ/RimL family protein N-acetyltransferase